MKNAAAFLLLSIAVVSCSKEKTATITKVDEKTGKTVTVEVPKDSIKEVQPTAAIKDSLGVFHQSFKLEKGKSYPLITLQKDHKTITAPTGESQSGTSESRDDMSFMVNDFKDGIYDINIDLISKKTSQSANGKSIVVDTKAAAPKEDELKMIWTVNKALVGNKLQMKMKENGDIISITGFDPIYKKIETAVNGLIKDAAAKKAFLGNFKQGFDEKIIKDQFSKNMKIIPSKGVKIGEKWTETENASADGKVKLTTTYQLKSVGNGLVEIGISGGIPKKSEKQTQGGMTHTMTSDLSQNGKIVIDQNTGWVKNQNIQVKTNQSESLSDGKQTQTMKSVSNSNVIINP